MVYGMGEFPGYLVIFAVEGEWQEYTVFGLSPTLPPPLRQ